VGGIFLTSFVGTIAIIGALLHTRLAWRIATDVPNHRSLHDAPIPRVGGWGVIPAAIVSVALLGTFDWSLSALAVTLFVVSYADDRIGLPIYVRLPAHVAAAAAWLMTGPADLPFHVAAMAAFAIAWVTNLFNFMDGADGLAGGMAVFAFGIYAAVASAAGVVPLAAWSLAVAGGCAAFLLFNFHPARVFLGDAGSVTIGFLAGCFGIWGWAAGAWPVWFPFLVAAPFFLDATVTILRRMLRGDKFWRAHREHYYQRLIRSGWSHRRTAICEYALMASSGGLAIGMLDWSAPAQYAGLAGALALYACLGALVDRRWSRYQRMHEQKAEEQAITPMPAADSRWIADIAVLSTSAKPADRAVHANRGLYGSMSRGGGHAEQSSGAPMERGDFGGELEPAHAEVKEWGSMR
jgi:UDP-N-acetylmuramyl pentapeptide phosphotransferase/UDP-N-acetylglucosamine-1-phosphate transferase